MERVFLQGRSIFKYPMRIVFLIESKKPSNALDSPVQVAFSVPKKKIKLAVRRNLLKRRMREAYRLNRKSILSTEDSGKTLSLVFIYQHKEILDYSTIEKSMIKLLKKVEEES